ncbi:hypothetical protein PCC7424_2767 [Gloeothece citriformis PCC 7424]|uniref:Uncharacterized protein n=1 Tax=Gloeothece citriformis (strain PCC 7424) TaxID=65393 RepID=B7K7Y2_GLOC7|nr:hypothetical protein [Gloeothece citriformis]ACK71178.1 hypothetical protein PCC7424_2767 [Gloeothece citriformis PCC 7424]
MTQSHDDQTHDTPPPKEIQPTLKMAQFIEYLQQNSVETPDDWEAAIKAWDECGVTLGNNWQKKRDCK